MALYDSENNRLLDTDDNVLTARVGFTVGNKEIQKQYIGTNEVKAIYLGTNLIYEKLFNIFVSVTNGTYDGASQIIPGGVSQVRIIPNGNYTFPLSVTVSGATSSYNATTGVITLSNVTSDVTISATCPLALTQLDAPVISLDNDTLTIEEVENAEYYDIYADDVVEESVPAVERITDLTGTKWLINELPSINQSTSFGINFTSYGTNYSSFIIDDDQRYSPNTIPEKLVYGSKRVYTGDYGIHSFLWQSKTYRFISITGGADATDTDLINWLYANATLLSDYIVTLAGWSGSSEKVFVKINDDPTWYWAELAGGGSGFVDTNIPNAIYADFEMLYIIPNVSKIKIGTEGNPTNYLGPQYDSSGSTGDFVNLTFTSTGSTDPAYATNEITMTRDSKIMFYGDD